MKNPHNPVLPVWLNSTISQCVALGLITLVAFIPSLFNGFVWDDTPYIVENPFLPVFDPEILKAFWMGNYHPLTMLTYFAEYQLIGPEPFLYHLDNLLLHVLNVFLVRAILLRLKVGEVLAFTASLLFALHPIHVESVTWISERKDVLYTLFFLLAVYQWCRYRYEQNKGAYGLTLLFFLLSCLSKGMAVTLPVALLALDLFHFRKSLPKLIVEYIPLGVISVGFGLLAIWAQRSSSAMRLGDYYSYFDHLIMGGYGLYLYLSKLIIPWPLSAVYPIPFKIKDLYFPTSIYVSAISLVVMGIAFWRGNSFLRLLILWFLGTLFHVLFAPVGSAIASDRYMYIPSIAFCWGLAWLILQKKNLYVPLLAVLTVGYAFLTFERTQVWKENFTLFSDVARQYPNDLLANNNIGLYHVKRKEYDQARIAYSRVVNAYPLDYTGYFNMGVAYLQEEKGPEAKFYFDQVLRLKPDYPDLPVQMGLASLLVKAYDTAAVNFRIAVQQFPGFKDYWYNLGLAESGLGNFQASDDALKKAAELDPQDPLIWIQLSTNAHKKGDFSAESQYEAKAKELSKGEDPGMIYRNKGVLLGEVGDYTGAQEQFFKAIALDSTDGEAWYNLGFSYEKSGNLNAAIPCYQRSAKSGYGSAQDLLKKNGMSW